MTRIVTISLDDLRTPDWEGVVHNLRADNCRAARNLIADLIEAQTRPAPVEPLGLGAVVKDADGTVWIRSGPGDVDWTSPDRFGWHKWTNVNAVEVLSEGVAP